MWLADGWKDYQVIDCSKGEKLERWGEYLLVRPGPTGHLGYPKDPQRLEAHERTLSSQCQRRRRMGIL